MQAFMQGQIKVEGDMSKLMAMQTQQPSAGAAGADGRSHGDDRLRRAISVRHEDAALRAAFLFVVGRALRDAGSRRSPSSDGSPQALRRIIERMALVDAPEEELAIAADAAEAFADRMDAEFPKRRSWYEVGGDRGRRDRRHPGDRRVPDRERVLRPQPDRRTVQPARGAALVSRWARTRTAKRDRRSDASRSTPHTKARRATSTAAWSPRRGTRSSAWRSRCPATPGSPGR